MEVTATPNPDERDDQLWLDQRLAFEEVEENLIKVESTPKKWHPVLVKFRDQLTAAAEKWEKDRQAHDSAKNRNPNRKQPGTDFDEHVFSSTGYDVGMLVRRHQGSAFRVTTLTYERALAIANAILFAAESRGCTVGHNELRSRLSIRLENAEQYVALLERQDYKTVKSSYGVEKRYKQTDKVVVSVEQLFGSRFELVDKQTRPVESRLNEFFVRLYRSVVVARAATRVQTEKDELKKVQDAAYEEITRQRAIAAKLKAEEQERRDALIDEAALWQQAEQIRAYAAHVLSHPKANVNPSALTWRDWATSIADQIDPSGGRLRTLISPSDSE